MVYVSKEDGEWLCREPPHGEEGMGMVRFLEGSVGTGEEVVRGVTAVKTGGHFRGSLVLHWEGKLFIADTIVTVPVSGVDDFFCILWRYSVMCTDGGLIEASLF